MAREGDRPTVLLQQLLAERQVVRAPAVVGEDECAVRCAGAGARICPKQVERPGDGARSGLRTSRERREEERGRGNSDRGVQEASARGVAGVNCSFRRGLPRRERSERIYGYRQRGQEHLYHRAVAAAGAPAPLVATNFAIHAATFVAPGGLKFPSTTIVHGPLAEKYSMLSMPYPPPPPWPT